MSRPPGTGTPEPRALHPRHGLHTPRLVLPTRRPGSVRRTVTIDTVRPDGLDGPAVQFGRLRDLGTPVGGVPTVLARLDLRATLDYVDNFRLAAIESDPADPRLLDLLGCSVSTGFRAAVAQRFSEEVAAAQPLYTILDDLPGAALVSGHALVAAGQRPERRASIPVLQVEGLCAGFQAGGTIMRELATGGLPPATTGPVANVIDTDDPLAVHERRHMGPHDMRRFRLLDVWTGSSPGDPIGAEAYFRDSHVDGDGLETVIHEYTVSALIDTPSLTVVSSSAEAHSLPWVECIQAEASGTRLAGRQLLGLRPAVREELVGTTTCTHLNDTLRSLEDVRGLLPLLAGQVGAGATGTG